MTKNMLRGLFGAAALVVFLINAPAIMPVIAAAAATKAGWLCFSVSGLALVYAVEAV